MIRAGTDVETRLAQALLDKWKREYEEETTGLPLSVDPELLSPVSDTSHGELALEYAAALLPVVRELGALRAAEELEAAGDAHPCTRGRLHDRAAALRGEAGR